MGIFQAALESIAQMTPTELIAQSCGIVGLVIMVLSFQCKSNRALFTMQLISASFFVANFLLISSWSGTLFNVCGILRCVLFMKNGKGKWKLIVVEAACLLSFVVTVCLNPFPLKILLSICVLTALAVSTVFMWQGNAKKIRWGQILCASPLWIVHNLFDFSIGGIICECFNIVSSAIYLIRSKKDK